jgi:hypothetical protein
MVHLIICTLSPHRPGPRRSTGIGIGIGIGIVHRAGQILAMRIIIPPGIGIQHRLVQARGSVGGSLIRGGAQGDGDGLVRVTALALTPTGKGQGCSEQRLYIVLILDMQQLLSLVTIVSMTTSVVFLPSFGSRSSFGCSYAGSAGYLC